MSVAKFGSPPGWFFDVYDAITQGVPFGPWPSIRQQPFYQRYRYRLVHEALRRSKINTANQAKAMGVIDIGSL